MKKKRKTTRRPKTIEVQSNVQRKFQMPKIKKDFIIQSISIALGCVMGYLFAKSPGLVFGGLLGLGLGKITTALLIKSKKVFLNRRH
jgi:F0F1-type ATP synthase assembly protein I